MESLKAGIVCCTRIKSSRVPNKCTLDINGKAVLNHLHSRLIKTDLPIVYAYPRAEESEYRKLFYTFDNCDFNTYSGYDDDPLKRMSWAADENDLDIIIRVVHDKIFVNPCHIKNCLKLFKDQGLDYLYSNDFVDGTAFEIFSKEVLKEAADKYKNVEHITYAMKAVSKKSYCVGADKGEHKDTRLLIDFPEDIDLMNTVFACLGNDCSQQQVLDFIKDNTWVRKINKLPKITIYTCAYNAEKWIERTMESVSLQNDFKTDYEYILIDDCSTDKTSFLMSRFASRHSNVKYIRNSRNIGLASSSNLALSKARSKYIVRIDADDYLVGYDCLSSMLGELIVLGLDALYPNFYNGTLDSIGEGCENHHPAGALFKTLALNHIRFKDGLRNLEGLDIYLRAKEFLNIGYLKRPIFFYRHHNSSMSKTNLKERAETRKQIEAGTL